MVFVIFAAFLITLVIYTYKLNVKSKNFPRGPLVLPIIGSIYALGLEPHKNLMKMRYGKIIGIDFGAYRGIIINDREIIKDLLSLESLRNRPPYEFSYHLYGKNRPGILYSDGKTHEEQRQFLSKYFKRFAMNKNAMEDLISEHIEKLIKRLDGKVGKPIVNEELFTVSTMNALWTIMTDVRHHEDEEYIECVKSARQTVAAHDNALALFYYPGLCKIFPGITKWKIATEAQALRKKYVNKMVDSIKDELLEENPRSLIEAYLQKIENSKDESSFSGNKGYENLSATINDLIVGGADTVAATLTWFVILFIVHPDIQKKFQDELDTVVGRKMYPSLNDKMNLPYVNACILEVMRYSCIAPLGFPRVTSQVVNAHGYSIPKGTIVMPNLYAVLHDPAVWKDPEIFRPERFLSEDGSTIVNESVVNYVFSTGKRICPGDFLAKIELFLFSTALFQRYTFNKDPNRPVQKIITNFGTVVLPKPHSMIINLR